ncbi:MAG: ddlB [Rickettsiaceae bacterium]|jgi:D-alanine-D-alanine ligase|nr:ddlB [Rickettsiaceae bacterium]
MHDFVTTFKDQSVVKEQSLTGKKHVVILEGGMSAERAVSLSSGRGVTEALIENGYKVTSVDFGADIAEVLMRLKPDIVYNCLHGTYGEDGCIPGLLNIMRIPYTHSGVCSSAIGFNKERSRDFFLSQDIKCAKGKIVDKLDNLKEDPMPRPYVIKPLDQGSSIGIEIIFEKDNFSFADYSFPYGPKILVEKYVKGREMQVAVLNGKALGVLEIKPLFKRFYDYETKYTDGMAEHIMPAQIPAHIYQKLMDISEKMFNNMGCKGIARAEFLYCEEDDECYALELNTHPGMTPLSICPEIAAYRGINFNDLVEEVLKSASYE